MAVARDPAVTSTGNLNRDTRYSAQAAFTAAVELIKNVQLLGVRNLAE